MSDKNSCTDNMLTRKIILELQAVNINMPLVIVIPWKKNLVTIKLSGLLFKFFQILVPWKQLFWKNLVSAGSKSSKVSPHTIFNKFAVFWWYLPYTKLLLLMSDPSVGIRSNKLCILSKSDHFLKKNSLYLERSDISGKIVPKSPPRTILDKFSLFLRSLTIDQTFTSKFWPFCPNQSKWTAPSLPECPIFQREVSLLEMIWNRLQKVPNSAPKPFLTFFLVFWGVLP